MEKLENCPICEKKNFDSFITHTDYTVSKEEFNIVECNACGFKFTNPRPTESEIGGYYKAEEYVSHTNSNKGLINKLYQIARKYTLSKKVKMVKKLSSGNTILDYGCGTGNFLNACKLKGWKAMGIEPDKGARDMAITEFGLEVISPAQLVTIDGRSFDVITLWHVLEHIHQLKSTLSTLIGALKDEGTLLIAVPNLMSYDARHYGNFWAAYDVPRHLYHFTPNDIGKLFESFSLKVVDTLPMTLDAYYVSLLSEKHRSGRANLINSFFIGLLSNIKAIGKNQYSSQIYVLRKNKSV